ncbi:hypothetical protein RRG08_043042 [Elysia crispata]|uniref:MAM domain-containing protein n=1 Tax=Elysia crispata TaxID=231223 RepID=A0AAE0XY19_9GAST|nr:hypothetical protein RRG08_043042 [Elysia crispata]
MSLRITSHASHLASTASSKLPLYTTTSILCLHFLLISLPLQLHIAEAKSGENTGCSFARDGCTYNIYLSQGELEEDALGESLRSVQLKESKLPCGQASKKVVLEDQVQNDYSAKLDNMEKNFSFLKDAHEQRLKELEGTIQKLVDTSVTDTKEEESSAETTRFSARSRESRNRFGDPNFMKKLEREFEKIRRDLRERSSELLDTQTKLNETNARMHQEQIDKFKTSKELLNAENQITALRRERAILKNQLKDKTYRLDVSQEKATECERKSLIQQDEILKLFRSESTLKEDLLSAEMRLNRTREEHTQLRKKHSELKTRQERVRRVLKIRERELMICYSAKTNTFCGFEDPDICGFTNINDTSDYFNWKRTQGRTPSSNTGPSKDHTCNAASGHFMFIEASAKGRGSNAILYSPLYRGLNQQCLDFFYHMYGRHIGTLNVYAQASGDTMRVAWRAFGNQGDHWTNARLAIPRELARAGYQIAFEGLTENGYQGDISIDDVSVTDGPCPVDEKVVAVRVEVNSTSVLRNGKTFARRVRRKMRRRRDQE